MANNSAAETVELFEAYQETGDPGAREQIAINYTPLVRSICRRFKSSREPQEDLFQVGMLGLLNAISKFDLTRGTSFSSLAIPEVLGSILNYLRDHGSLLKIPRNIRKNKLTIDKVSDSMATALGRWPTLSEIAEACELSEVQVAEATELSRIGDPRSLDEQFESDDSDGGGTLAEYVGYEDRGFDLSLDRLTLATALDTLPEREKTILRFRYHNELSQRQIAELLEISQMHVSRLERGALQKVRTVLLRRSAALNAPDGDLMDSRRTVSSRVA